MVKKFEVKVEPFFNNEIIYPLERSIRRRILIQNIGDEEIRLQINASCPDMPRPKLFQLEVSQRDMPKEPWVSPAGRYGSLIIKLEISGVVIVTFMMDEPDFWPEDVVRTKDGFLAVNSLDSLEGEYIRTARFEIFLIDEPNNKKIIDVKSIIKLVPPKKLENSFVSGKVHYKGKAIPDVEVKLRAASCAYLLSTRTNESGHFTIPCHSEYYRTIPYKYQLEAEATGYEAFQSFVEPPEEGVLNINASLKKTDERADYKLVKSIQLGAGGWTGKVSNNEKYFALGLGYWHEGEGQWSWIGGKRPDSLNLNVFDLNGNLLWKKQVKGEVWGLDVSNSGYILAGERGIPDYMKPEWRPRDVGKPGLGPGPTGGENPEVHLFDSSGKLLWKKPGIHEGLAISPNEKFVAVGGGRGVDIYELKTGNPVRNLYCDEQVLRVRFTSDNSRLIVGGGVCHLYCFNLDGKLLWRTHIGSWPYMYGLDMTPDDMYIATAGKIGDVRILDENGKVIVAKNGEGHCRGVSIAADGSYIIVRCVGSIGTSKINKKGEIEWMRDPTHSGSITGDSKYILNSQYTIKLLNTNGTILWSYNTNMSNKFSYISKNATKIVAADDNGKAYFFEGAIKKL